MIQIEKAQEAARGVNEILSSGYHAGEDVDTDSVLAEYASILADFVLSIDAK